MSHRIFPRKSGLPMGIPSCTYATLCLRWNTSPTRPSGGLQFLAAQISLQSWDGGEVSSPALPRTLAPTDPGQGGDPTPGPAPRSQRAQLRGLGRIVGRLPVGGPGLARNPPFAPGLQSVVPATELAAEQKPLCGGQAPATIGLCAAPVP